MSLDALPPVRKRGPEGSLTPIQRAELWAWYQAKREIGTFAAKARELGLTEYGLQGAINNLKRRAGEL